jgi:hypothetical protein
MKNKDFTGGMGCLVAAVGLTIHAMDASSALTTILAGALALFWLLAGLALLIEHITGK